MQLGMIGVIVTARTACTVPFVTLYMHASAHAAAGRARGVLGCRRWRTSRRTLRTATTTASASTESSRASCCKPATLWVRFGSEACACARSLLECMLLSALLGATVGLSTHIAGKGLNCLESCGLRDCTFAKLPCCEPRKCTLSEHLAMGGPQEMARGGSPSGAASLATRSAATCGTTAHTPCPWQMPGLAPTAARCPANLASTFLLAIAFTCLRMCPACPQCRCSDSCSTDRSGMRLLHAVVASALGHAQRGDIQLFLNFIPGCQWSGMWLQHTVPG